jgi:predicted TIM-barrel fold metal-dependent hydrolase
MYGTDYPCWDSRLGYELFSAIDLSDADREKVLSGTARRFMNSTHPCRKPPACSRSIKL